MAVGVQCMVCLRPWGVMNDAAFADELRREGVVARFCHECAGTDEAVAEQLIELHEPAIVAEQRRTALELGLEAGNG